MAYRFNIQLLFISLLFFIPFSSLGEDIQYFNNLKVKDGLPSNEVFCISQDSVGFIWIATNSGFVRYDGYNMQIYRNDKGAGIALPDNDITCIEKGSDLDLWIGSYEGLLLFNSKTGDNEAVNLGGVREIRTVLNQGDSILWAGSSDGLFKVKISDKSFKLFTQQNSKLGSNIVRSLYLSSKNELWIGTFDGLNMLNKSGEMLHFDLKGKYKPELKNNLILNIHPFSKTNDSLLWIGTETGLVLFDTNLKTHRVFNMGNLPIANEVVKCIYSKDAGNVFFGTDFGFYQFNLETQELKSSFHNPFNNFSISNNVIWDIFEDNADVLWLATSNGISKLNFNQSIFRYTPVYTQKGNEIIGTQVNDIYTDANGTVWLATKNGVNVIYSDGHKESFTANSQSKNRIVLNNVNTISGDKLGRIWIGSAGGINIWDPNQQKMHTITANFDQNTGLRSNYIGTFMTPSDDSFWVATWGGGIYKVKGNFNRIEDITFEYIANFNTSAYTADKKIWLAQDQKVYSIDLNTFQTETNEKLNAKIKNANISSIHLSSKGELWIGAYNTLLKYNIQSEEFNEYELLTGNESGVLNLLEDHSGNIWGTTLTSIFKFNVESQIFEIYPKNETIPLDNFLFESKVIANNGELFFGGNDGFISFFPHQIRKNNFQPNVMITALWVGNNEVKKPSELGRRNRTNNQITYVDEIVLKHHQSSFKLQFSSLHLGEPERNIYAYKLDGFDEDWIYTTGNRNYVSYSNLSSGKYSFKVKGTNNDGVWSVNETSLRVIVKPPIWASPFAIVAYILLFQVALFLIITTYRNKVQWKQRIKLITLEKEKNEELAKSKQQFFTNISHEFRTPLSLILGPVESIQKSSKLDEHNSQLLSLISKNALRLLSLVNQLLDLRKIELNKLQLKTEEADLIELCLKQYHLFIDMAESKKMNYHFNSNVKSIQSTIDIPKFESVIQNLLSNAFKYTPEAGTINFTANFSADNIFQLKISDNGIGISDEVKPNMFKRFYQGENSSATSGYGIGLNIAKEYCELMNGKIWFETEAEIGTTFFVEIPVLISDNQSEFKEPLSIESNSVEITEPILIINSSLPTLLLVDDHPDTLKYLQIKLSAEYNLLTANHGKQAFLLLAKYQIDLIISDIMMPELDGIGFCEKLKKNPKYENIPLILLTAKTSEIQKAEGFRAGTDAYLTKPFNIDVLKAQIDGLLSKNRKISDYIKRQLIVENQDVEVQSSDEKLLQEAIHYINKHISETEINLEKMCRHIGVSHSSLYRKVKSQTGQTLNELIRSTKLKKAAQLLKTNKLSIAEIMAETGFTNHSYFAKCFKKEFGETPRDYTHSKK